MEDAAKQATAPRGQEIHRDIAARGVRMRITEWGASDTTDEYPIVALPGLLAPRTSFASLASELGGRFRIIAVDFPGFGESEKPAPTRFPYGVKAFAEGIADLFAGLRLSRAHVLGHGLGGAVALRLAAGHPELVARLALIAPWVHATPTRKKMKLLLAPLVGGLLFRQLIGKGAFARIYREKINAQTSPEALDAYYSALAPPAARAALLATLRASWDTRGAIADCRRVRAPTLLVWGHEDQLFPVQQGRLLSREMPQAGLELLQSGHAPHEQIPGVVAPILARFFSGQRAGLT